jgi:hypothetical protein
VWPIVLEGKSHEFGLWAQLQQELSLHLFERQHKTMSMNTADHLLDPPTLLEYAGETSFFEGTPPLSQGVGYLVVLGFGAAFSVFTTLMIYANQAFGVTGDVTSEHFK